MRDTVIISVYSDLTRGHFFAFVDFRMFSVAGAMRATVIISAKVELIVARCFLVYPGLFDGNENNGRYRYSAVYEKLMRWRCFVFLDARLLFGSRRNARYHYFPSSRKFNTMALLSLSLIFGLLSIACSMRATVIIPV